MAPTETLAEQHFLTLESFCTQLGVTCGLLTSSVGKRDREQAAQAAVVVGTHALIQAGVDLGELAVAVVDEQHRFGVEQRKALSAGTRPHTLHMTATPIPRTLALTVYGDLAVSEIAELPAGRRPIVTSWVTAERSSEAYRRLRRHLEAGRQAYVVCPLVSESVAIEARAAEQEAERLQRAELRGLRVGCMHGQLRPAERRDLMARFKAGELDVLVATTVIEVGVDVPNATIMIVQEADRFGLAQLHQLRGRVGRGRGAVVLPARLAAEGGAHGDRDRSPGGARRDCGRLPAGRGRSRAARRRRAARHPPVRASRTSGTRGSSPIAHCSSSRAQRPMRSPTTKGR